MLRAVVWIACVACAAPPVVHPSTDRPSPRTALDQRTDQTRFYSIFLGGARVGTASEAEAWTPHGVHVRRIEVMTFLRGDAEVSLTTQIDIDADLGLHPQQVRWMENNNGVVRSADAAAQLAHGAVPAELVPLLVRRDGRFSGAVFLPARNFVAGHGRIDAVAPGRLIARLALDAGPLAEATIDQASDGMPARVVDGDGVIALRISAAQAQLPFPAVDLVAATALPIGGRRHSAHRLMLDGNIVLPALPGQAATVAATGVAVDLGAQLPGGLPDDDVGPDRANEIRTLVAGVRARITPDLGATTGSARDADAATAGDCTTFALAYAALATRRGIPTRVVTGLRVDRTEAGDRLVRHRWAVSWTGRAWIAVDAAFGAVPAGGDLIGLAIHDADDAGLVSGEAALNRVHAASWN